MKHLIRYVFTLASCVFTTTAFAADGTILINQATVMAAGGFPFTIGQPGSYKLSGNLVTSNTGAMTITAPNVTLDLNGFTISCASCTGPAQVGIGGQPQGATILNGKVTGFGGSCINLGDGSLVDHLAISKCNGDGIVVQGDVSIMNSIISQVQGDGINATTASVVNTTIDGFSNNGIECRIGKIANSIVRNGPSSGAAGIWLSTGGVISGSVIQSVSKGVYVSSGAATLINNVFMGNFIGIQAAGVALAGSNTFSATGNSDFGTLPGNVVSQRNNLCSNGSGC